MEYVGSSITWNVNINIPEYCIRRNNVEGELSLHLFKNRDVRSWISEAISITFWMVMTHHLQNLVARSPYEMVINDAKDIKHIK